MEKLRNDTTCSRKTSSCSSLTPLMPATPRPRLRRWPVVCLLLLPRFFLSLGLRPGNLLLQPEETEWKRRSHRMESFVQTVLRSRNESLGPTVNPPRPTPDSILSLPQRFLSNIELESIAIWFQLSTPCSGIAISQSKQRCQVFQVLYQKEN